MAGDAARHIPWRLPVLPWALLLPPLLLSPHTESGLASTAAAQHASPSAVAATTETESAWASVAVSVLMVERVVSMAVVTAGVVGLCTCVEGS
jgi:hypothetical protein